MKNMYLHIGNNKIVRTRDVIGIFDADTATVSKTTRAYLSEKEKLGVSQFHVVFRALTGMTPTQYITKLRMSLAARLLRDATLSVGEVAEACGYGDMFYFSRVFRREMGVSPSAYHKGTP